MPLSDAAFHREKWYFEMRKEKFTEESRNICQELDWLKPNL